MRSNSNRFGMGMNEGEPLSNKHDFVDPENFVKDLKNIYPNENDVFYWNTLAEKTIKKNRDGDILGAIYATIITAFFLLMDDFLPKIYHRDLYKGEYLVNCAIILGFAYIRYRSYFKPYFISYVKLNPEIIDRDKSIRLYNQLTQIIQSQSHVPKTEGFENNNHYVTKFDVINLDLKIELFMRFLNNDSSQIEIILYGNKTLGISFNRYILDLLEKSYTRNTSLYISQSHYINLDLKTIRHALNHKLPIHSYIKPDNITTNAIDIEDAPLFIYTDRFGMRTRYVSIFIGIGELMLIAVLVLFRNITNGFLLTLYVAIYIMRIILLIFFRTSDFQLKLFREKKVYFLISKDHWKYIKTQKEMELLLKINLNDLGNDNSFQNKISKYVINNIPFTIPWGDLRQDNQSMVVPVLIRRNDEDEILDLLTERFSNVFEVHEAVWNGILKEVFSMNQKKIGKSREKSNEKINYDFHKSNLPYPPIAFLIILIIPLVIFPLILQGVSVEYTPPEEYLIFDNTFNSDHSISIDNAETGRYYIVASYISNEDNYQKFKGRIIIDDKIIHEGKANRYDETFFEFDLVISETTDVEFIFNGIWQYTVKIYHGQPFPLKETSLLDNMFLFSMVYVALLIPFHIESSYRSINDKEMRRLIGSNDKYSSNILKEISSVSIIIGFFSIFTTVQLLIKSSYPKISLFYDYFVTSNQEANLYFSTIWFVYIISLTSIFSVLQRSFKSSLGYSALIFGLSTVMIFMLFPNLVIYLKFYWFFFKG